MKKINFEIVRGDNKSIFIQLTDNNEVDNQKVEKMFFSVKNDGYENDVLFQKKLDAGIKFDDSTGIYEILIFPEDTDDLDFCNYKYDLQIIDNNIKETLMSGFFSILEEITNKNNEG